MAKLFIIARNPAPSLCISMKISPKDPSEYSPVRKYTLCPPTIAFCVYPLRRSGIFSRSVLMISLITTFSTIFSAMTAAFSCGVPVSRISAASSSSSINAAAKGCDSFDPSRYSALALVPKDQLSSYAFWQSSIVASFGMLIVFEIAPEINDCAAAIIVMWLLTDRYRLPFLPHGFAQSKMCICSSFKCGAPSRVIVPQT